MSLELPTDRLLIREWELGDAEDALKIYGADEVAHWLTPEWHPVNETDAMRSVLHAWIEAGPNLIPPAGRWAIVRRQDGQLVGGLSLKLLPPFEEDFELSWALRPDVWGRGYATEASRAVIAWAFEQGIEEVFAVARPRNERAIAVARRLGMEWVGETEKYYDMRLQVFRLRPG
ncbi:MULTISPECIES: GNAT family N-acetyltransferase [Nocardiopsidaceae]|jgi:RimJ/RimL family protein N-acetyltransferase|uniref:GNAT family N-acetyltransferase n=2 Tax=Nocardiopsidaceae TaxID=83676 RepID=A0ABY6YUN1_9ACTN|nr:MULTISPECIES: GNAT family N-acetyltransferase [Nocardiopsaceae]MEE2045547.1 GNAT family N-acetyltransferase [Nocardiopsis tropica]MEE2053355.1 GNAT family N-acetyltransferase [Nocardiopsis umidischolae]WAE76110.1 GNAT family N-acetyltransferase [Streptomonospora nanhaiensis]